VLIKQPILDPVPNVLPQFSQGWLWSNKLMSRTRPCKLINVYISVYTRMSGDQDEAHTEVSEKMIQNPSAL